MAADGVNKLKILLVHGNQKLDLDLTLPPDKIGDVLTVRHLSDSVAVKTGVPVSNQKLICKGKSLADPTESLHALGIKDGSKVMLIGKKFNPEDDAHLQKIQQVADDVSKCEKKLSDVIYQVDGIHRGFINANLQAQSLAEQGKKLFAVGEVLTKALELVDALVLGDSATEVRGARKQLVTRVQDLLYRCDGVQKGVDEMLTRLADK